MTAIVLELQHDALTPGVELSDLLRKAFVVAKKLEIADFEQWISSEMNGYSDTSALPEYRYVGGAVRVLNPARGWIPARFDNPDFESKLSRMPLSYPVSELQAVIAGVKKGGSVMLTYSHDLKHRLLRQMPLMADVGLEVPLSRVKAILDSVRNIILQWALRLEADGITGAGLTFSREEKKVAAQQNYAVYNFYGNVNNPQIQQHSPGAIQVGGDLGIGAEQLRQILDALRAVRNELGETQEGEELEAEIQTIEVQAKSPKPKFGIIKDALGSSRRIVEGAAGRLLSEAILRQTDIMALLGSIT